MRLLRAFSVIFVALLGLPLSPIVAEASLIPPFFINSVVALGGIQSQPALPGQPTRSEWQTEGTGFFYGYLVKNDPDPLKREYQIYLVTARHVVEEHINAQRGDINIRINPKEATSKVQEFTIPQKPPTGAETWHYHPNPAIDIAIVPINFVVLTSQGLEFDFFRGDSHVLNRDNLKEQEITAGDGVFVLGFPMNLAGALRNYVIVRQGCIARITEMLDKASTTFMVDAFAFPGNSGGPVVSRPEVFAIDGTKPHTAAYLIGMVTSYRPYNEVAVSMQTKQPRVIFQENSGLVEVLPVDYIDEAIKSLRGHNSDPTSKP